MVHAVLNSREGKDFTVATVRNQCREFRLMIISKVFLSGLQNHRVFAKLDAGHSLVRLWLPVGRFPTGIQFPWLMLFVVLVSFFFPSLFGLFRSRRDGCRFCVLLLFFWTCH